MPLRFSPARGASAVISSSSRGPTGAAATIAVGTVTTGAAGSSASVTNVGSSSAAVFDFAIPRGNTGNATGPGSSTSGNLASWNGTGGTTLADSGVLATAVYRAGGTDVPVADGGTGSSTAAGAATNLGLGTGDSPQFTAVNIGAATDTTITRTGAGDIAVEGNAIYRAGGTDVPVADGGTGSSTAAGAVTNLGLDNTKIAVISFIIDGGGSAITTGIKGDLEIPFACTINRSTVLLDQSGSIVIDLWVDSYGNYPPTIADTITASAKPTISSALKAQDSTLTGWTTSIAAGSTIRFNVDSITTATRALIALKVTKT